MCGISAIINTASKEVDVASIRRMNAEIEHRGPDGGSIFIEGPVALGHRMLKITDLGDANVQPMRLNGYVISYNGEIYNFREIRRELEQLGYTFHTETDTEVVLAAYDAWKDECVHHFNGMWAFVLFDQKRNLVFASRDRFGIKPLCYTQLHGKFLIGSEIKQFTTFSDFQAKLNQSAAFEFLYCGRLNNDNNSIFENVHFLPAGSNLYYELSNHTFRVSKWYELRYPTKTLDITLPEAILEFRRKFGEAVMSHLYSRVPMGSNLSGGMDSTSMVGIATEAGVRLKTYSSCFHEKEFNEIEFIDAAVDFYKQENFKIYPDFHELITKRELERLVYQQDQPVTCGSFYTEYKIYSLAASHQTRVILGGGGADEYLGGYGEFPAVHLQSLLRERKFLSYTYEFLQLPRLQIRTTELLRPYWHALLGRTALASHDFVKDSFRKDWFQDHFLTPESPLDKKDLCELSIFELSSFSLPHQLHSEDRSSMNFSLESRLPFLDHRLVEFCLSLPDSYKLRNGTTKYLLREGLRSILPKAVYERKSKMGMPGPEEPIFKAHYGDISERFKEMIQNFPDIFSDKLMVMLRNYCEGQIPYDNFLFRALSFGAWAKAFNVCSSYPAQGKRPIQERTGEHNFEKSYVTVKN